MFIKIVVLVLLLVLSPSQCRPLSVLQSDHPPLAAELSSRVAARAARLMPETTGDPRLGIPSIQDLAAIKKVAEMLIMLGQEVIPSIIGETPPDTKASVATTEASEDTVNN